MFLKLMNGLTCIAIGLAGQSLLGFEHTKVLPKGVRNLTIKSVRTSIGKKSNKEGIVEGIASPLEKEMTFKKVVNGESGLKKTQLEALMLYKEFSPDDSLGKLSADMQGNVAVTAPVFSLGLLDNLTLALAVPFYQADMAIKLGFQIERDNANKLLRTLEEQNQIGAANDVAAKLNDAEGSLNGKLRDNGFRELKDWHGEGVGDVTIASKYKALDDEILKVASTNGFLLPTGKTSHPDILNDIPFGKGTLDFFSTLALDQHIREDLFFNQFVKYTHHFPARRKMRMVTEEEAIEVDTLNVRYELGANIDAGTSLQYEPESGLVLGLGYNFAKKMGDKYIVSDRPDTVNKLEKDTHQLAQYWEAKIGYSGVHAYKRGEIPAPFSATVEYKKHIASVNTFTNDFVTMDLALFF